MDTVDGRGYDGQQMQNLQRRATQHTEASFSPIFDKSVALTTRSDA